MLANAQRMAIPELTRVFGHHGLYLRPLAGMPVDLSGNMLANVLSLHREDDRLAGQLRCRDGELPISSASLSLVYSLFMLETSPEPDACLQEIARSLKPEGVVLLIGLNSWGFGRLRWWLAPGVRCSLPLERMAQDAGLEVVRRLYLGPYWPRANRPSIDQGGNRWLDGFRVASLTVLRRREAALTPLRKTPSTVSLRPGMSTG